MANKSYADSITEVQFMISGLKNHKDNLPAGLDEAFIKDLERLKEEVEAINNEQEILKANLKAKTEESVTKQKEMQSKVVLARKRVKLDIPQSLWIGFGIEDKK